MARLDRPRFLAFGVLSTANAVALALYALGLATHGRGPAADAQPVLFVLIGLCLLGALGAAILRGHDLGRPAWQVLAGFVFSLTLGPVVLAYVALLAWTAGEPVENAYGPPPGRAGAAAWLGALAVAALPWLAFAIAVRFFY